MDALTPQEIEQVLAAGMVAHVGVVDGGTPYVTPLSYVYSGGAIVFRTLEGRRSKALRDNPRACVEVLDYDREAGGWRSVVAFGDAEIVDDDIATGAFIAQMQHKYEQPFEKLFGAPDQESAEAGLLVRIALDEIEGRMSGRFLGTRTRPGRL